MDAQKRIQKALRRVDIDIECGVYKRLSESGKERMTFIMYVFLTEYTKLIENELDYSRSGCWLNRVGKLTYYLFRFLPGKQKEKAGGNKINRKRG